MSLIICHLLVSHFKTITMQPSCLLFAGNEAAGLGAYAAWIMSLCSNCENNTISA